MSSPTSPDSTAANQLAEIRVPRETVNDDTVTIQQWHIAHGEPCRVKQLVVSIETSKAVLEVEAEAEGFIDIIHAQGTEVPIGELIGRVVSSPSQMGARAGGGGSAQAAHPPSHANGTPPRSSNRLRDRAAQHEGSDSRSQVGASAGGGRRVSAVQPASDQQAIPAARDGSAHVLPPRESASLVFSKKAQALINEHQLDAPSIFAGMGLVREVDVIRHLESRIADHQREHPSPPSPATIAAAAPIEPRAAAATVNSAYPTKTRGLLGDASSSAKDRGNKSIVWLAWNYFWRNWLLGNLARWAPRGVILPIHRMRGVKMGRDVFIDPTAIIETAFPENITIGNDVRITAGCVIMSHIKAPHYLRESGLVPVVLKPVVLEDHCFIGVNSVIMPGVTIGKASVVTSGSVVVTNVPPYTMVQGNPAKVIKHFPRPT